MDYLSNVERRGKNVNAFLAFLLFLCMTLAPGRVWAQEKSVTLDVQGANLESVLKQIEKQTDLTFFYDQSVVDAAPAVTVRLSGVSPQAALDAIARQTGLSFNRDNNTVTVGKGSQAGKTTGLSTVRGKVVDANGEPLVGVSVALEGSSRGVITDADGNYTLSNVPQDAYLVFSYVGFETARLKAGARHTREVILREDAELLDEVVVVGYGTQKKVNLTGAVAVVESEELVNRSAPNMSRLLQGAVPNMTINFASGSPIQGGTINIRGINTISGTANPLVLIDGIEGDINSVNPNDVESISVLKDASSSAVYGARAAYGVILITTKESSENKVTVNYNGRFSFGKNTTSTDYETRGFYSAAIANMFYSTYQGIPYQDLTEEDYYEMWIRRNDAVEDPSRPWVVEKNGQYKYYGNFDWYNFLFDNTRPTWEHNVSVSGGNDKVKYLLSGNYYTQRGVMRIDADRYKKYNFRSKITAQLNDWLEISNNTSYYATQYTYPGRSGTEDMFNKASCGGLANVVPVNPDGSLVYLNPMSNTGANQVMGGIGAILLSNQQKGRQPNKQNSYDFSTTFEVAIKPVKHLEIRGSYNWSRYNYNDVNRNLPVQYSMTPGVLTDMTVDQCGGNYLAEEHNANTRQTINAYATYDNLFAGKHNVKIMGGVNYESRYYKNNFMRREGSLSDELNDFNLATGEDFSITGGQNEYKLFGMFYRLNYGFNDRYLFEASGRYDGSSRFRRGDRYGFFPSFSAAWRVSEEEFFQPAKKYMDNLKLRLSYGSLGNQASVGYYDYMQLINTGSQLNYKFGGSSKAYYASESAPNASDMTWETVITKNIGLDMGFLGNRLNVGFDAYIRDTKDMLMPGKTLPAVYGASSPKMNAADLRTKGWELSATWDDSFVVAGKPLRYQVTFGIGDNTSEITKYDNPNKTLTDPYVGMKLGDIWGYKIDGYFLSDEEAANWKVDQSIVNTMINQSVIDNGLHAGDLKFVDVDGNGKIEKTTSANDIKDQVIIGNSMPRYNYSASLSASWNGIDVSMLFQGVGRQHWYPNGEAMDFWGPYARPYTARVPRDFMSQVWSEENPNAYFPRPRGYVALISDRELVEVNNRYLQNVGYCRLKNFTIGYTLPKKWTQKVQIQKLRVYFSGENLLTFSKLHSDFIDPEQASGTNAWNSYRSAVQNYPYAKMFSFGVEIQL